MLRRPAAPRTAPRTEVGAETARLWSVTRRPAGARRWSLVKLNGQPCSPAALRARVGFVSQEDTLHPEDTVMEAVMAAGRSGLAVFPKILEAKLEVTFRCCVFFRHWPIKRR